MIGEADAVHVLCPEEDMDSLIVRVVLNCLFVLSKVSSTSCRCGCDDEASCSSENGTGAGGTLNGRYCEMRLSRENGRLSDAALCDEDS